MVAALASLLLLLSAASASLGVEGRPTWGHGAGRRAAHERMLEKRTITATEPATSSTSRAARVPFAKRTTATTTTMSRAARVPFAQRTTTTALTTSTTKSTTTSKVARSATSISTTTTQVWYLAPTTPSSSSSSSRAAVPSSSAPPSSSSLTSSPARTTTVQTTQAPLSTSSSSSSRSSSSSASSSSSSPSTISRLPTSSSSSSTTTTIRSSPTSPSPSPVPTTSAAVCAPRYTAAAGVATISGTGTLPRPTAFVKRSGQQLSLDGKNYRIVGPNVYWLCSDENAKPWAAPPDKGRVREALAIAVAMGANTIRIHTCGISVGPNSPYNLEPSKGVFQSSLWDIRDYVLFAAREYGLRVILPLTDNYDYYHGGRYDFLDFAGLSRANAGAKFYTAKAPIAAYQEYITKIISRVNSYTGVSYAADPTILAWETGNELGGYINAEMWPPASWTNSIISTIRKVDKSHLIIDGTGGFWNYSTNATPDGLHIAGVDLMTDHGYPRNTGILNKESQLAKQAGKGFFIGEYDWTTQHGGVPLADYLSVIEGAGSYLGDMIWNIMGHDSQCCAFVPHNDGYSLYYPNGNSAADQANILAVVKHWYKVTGRAQPSALPAVACPQPVF